MVKTIIGVIADDFTGANDTGLQFRKKGASTGVFLNLSDINEALTELDTVVYDTESRFDDKKTSFEKVKSAAQVLTQNGIPHVYKKLDSTMRGNIGAEIDGAIEGTKAIAAFVVPAMPTMGRTTIDSICYVNGIAVSQTEAASDPKTPIVSSHIPTIIAQQSKRKIQTILLNEIQNGSEAIYDKIRNLIGNGNEIIVVDAASKDDLKKIAKAIMKLDKQKVFVGSSGFAEYIGGELNFSSSKKHELSINNTSNGLLIAAGSASEVTISQVCYAFNQRNVYVIDLDIEQMFSQREKEKFRMIEIAGKRLTGGKDVIIRTIKNRGDIQKTYEIAAKAGFSTSQCSENISSFTGEVTCNICVQFKPGGLVLTGGDIAIKTIKAMEVTGTIIKDEVLPGIASGSLISDKFKDMIFVTKAGAFGKEDALVKIIDYLKAT